MKALQLEVVLNIGSKYTIYYMSRGFVSYRVQMCIKANRNILA